MDNKRVDSPPANSDDVAIAPPHEVSSPSANSADMATAPPRDVDSPPANSDDMAIAPPHEVASPPANSADMATAPPPKMVDHCQPQPQAQPHMYPPIAKQMPQMQIAQAPATAPAPTPSPQQHLYQPMPMQVPQMHIAPAPAPAPTPSPRPGSKVYYQTTSDMEDTLEWICPHCNARIHPREEHHPTGKTYALTALICATLLCWPCVVAPFWCKCFYETFLFCPKCQAWLGKF